MSSFGAAFPRGAIPCPSVSVRVAPSFKFGSFELSASLVFAVHFGRVSYQVPFSPGFARQLLRVAFWVHPVLSRSVMLSRKIGLYRERDSRGANEWNAAFPICELVCSSMFVRVALSSDARTVSQPASTPVLHLDMSASGGACLP